LEEFEELTADVLKDFINITPTRYNTSQKKLCFAIIKRMYRRVKMGYKNLGGIKICNDKGIVIDGNHRYITYLLAGIEIEYIIWTSSLCDEVVLYKEVEIDETKDWDEYLYDKRKFIKDKDFIESYNKENKNDFFP